MPGCGYRARVRALIPLVLVGALALAGCQGEPGPSDRPEPSGTEAIGPLPGQDAPAPSPSETRITAEGDPDAPEGYPTAPATAFPECVALAPAVAGIVPEGLAFDQAQSDAQDQEDVAVERSCAWVAGDRVVRLTVSGIEFAPSELVALSQSRLTIEHVAAGARGLFVMGTAAPPDLAAPFEGTVNVFDQFHTVSIGWAGPAERTTAEVVDAAVAVHEILRG